MKHQKINSFHFLLILVANFSCGLWIPYSNDNFSLKENDVLRNSKDLYLASKAEINQKRGPNIIWIIVDDLGIADTDLYGSGTVHTPNINSLADQGIRFTNAYVTSPICSPSRASMLTGRYNQRFGFEHQIHNRYLKNKLEYIGFKNFVNSNPWEPQNQKKVPNQSFIDSIGLPLSEITIAEVLKKQSYHTGLMGKWHLSKQYWNAPNAFGFDEFYGFMNSHSLYADNSSEIADVKNKRDWTDHFIRGDKRDGLSAIQRNGSVIEEERYLTNAITDESITFIEKNKGLPFFLIISYNAPHSPFQAPKKYMEQYNYISDPIKRVYAAMIKCLDDEIGRLVIYLESTDQLENSLIFFVSDNGGAEYTYATNNGPYKGGKITDFEGGLKVPMFMVWKNRLEENTKYELPVSSLDLFATSVEAAQADFPERIYDGTDLIPKIVRNEPAHDYLYFKRGYNEAIRSMTHKMIWNTNTQDTLLFELDSDKYEKSNGYNEASKILINSLTREFQNWKTGLQAPLWPPMIDFMYKDEDGNVYSFEN